ncbi:hypothetical protein GIB67_033834 [Kingdonia uniflora]|uniref:Uncharacterized protein n=1 Tax=Kingdonia uniflora TaxID=39325 RepID=A0A7J7LID2_9MAGN|nr:hypothetical protein GIB67_033834 [Kingdonia uniflora]
MKTILVKCLLLSLLFNFSLLQTTMVIANRRTQDPYEYGFCSTRYKVRCGNAAFGGLCSKICMFCCLKCICVPSGTIGHTRII